MLQTTKRPNRRLKPVQVGALVAIVIIIMAASVASQVTIQSLSGCAKITKAGVYELDTLNLSGIIGDCFDIQGSEIVLFLNGATISGSGTGAGIHITGANAFIEGGGAQISGFADGVEVASQKAVVENFSAESNADAGILLSNAKYARLTNFTASENSNDGVRISKGSYNAVGGATAISSNIRYGVWLSATMHNAIGGIHANDNAIAGVYVGCSTSGPIGQACVPKTAASTYNLIFDGTVEASSPGSQQYGVALDLGDGSNRVSNMTSVNGNELVDFLDENANCGQNAWFGEGLIFSSSPSGCIH